MAAASDGHAAAIEFDGFIETCFLSLEETNYESCVTALVGAEAALSRMKKSTKLDAARRRHEIAATDNTAREEVWVLVSVHCSVSIFDFLFRCSAV